MFNPIPGNDDFLISLSMEVVDKNGNIVEKGIENGKLRLDIYGKNVVCDLKWLSLISHYEMYLENPSYQKLLNISFTPVNAVLFKRQTNFIPYFIKPEVIKFNKKIYRIIPNYSKYAVSQSGEILEISTSRILKVSYPSEKLGWKNSHYPTVRVYSPDKKHYVDAKVHRLVAAGWLTGSGLNLILRPIVNHKDSNKDNFHLSNLELCSYSENSLHAYSEGLRSDNISCKVRDFETGTVHKFHSKSQAAEFMCISKAALVDCNINLRKHRLYNNRFEFKLEGDNDPWFYEGRTKLVKEGRYTIVVKDKISGNIVNEFYHTEDFKKAYKLWNTSGMGKLIDKAKNLYPDLNFDYKDNYNLIPIQLKNLSTQEILEFKNISETAKYLGKPKGVVRNSVRSKFQTSVSNHAIRFKSDEEWKDVVVNKDLDRSVGLQAVNKITKEVKTFPSIRSMSRSLKMDTRRIREVIGKEIVEINDWIITKKLATV